MSRILLDTHVWAWTLDRVDLLSGPATEAIETATSIYLSPVSIYEIGQKTRLGKWPEMESRVSSLTGIAEARGVDWAPLTPDAALRAAMLDWPHRDPFDRIIAATALEMRLDLVSADQVFDGVGVRRVW